MKKILLTIGILTLTALAGTLWYLQNNKNETTVPTVSVVINEKTNNNAEKLQTKETSKQAEKKISDGNEKVLTEKDANDEIDTSNWKEYCNEKYGFCLKYPENFTPSVGKLDETTAYSLSDKTKPGGLGRPEIRIDVYHFDQEIDFDEWIKKSLEIFHIYDIDLDNIQSDDMRLKYINGKKAFAQDFVVMGPGATVDVLYDNNTIISFTISMEDIDLAKTILETVRFTSR